MVIEHGAAPLHDAVQRPRNANVQALHAARQRQARVRLDKEMEVVAEDGELDEAEPEPFARIGEALFDRTEQRLLRRFHTPAATRKVTSATLGLSSCARALCDTLGRGAFRLRPAPFRFPPLCGIFNASCFI